MENVYDRKERVVGYLNGSTVYGRHQEVLGYMQGPVLLDTSRRRIAYIKDNTLYAMTGRPLAYFDGRAVRDLSGRRLGQVSSVWPGLLSTALLLRRLRHSTEKYADRGYDRRTAGDQQYSKGDNGHYDNQPGPYRPRKSIKEYYQTGRTMVRKYGPIASYAWKYVLAEPAFGYMGKMGGYWPLVSLVGRYVFAK